MVNDVCLRHRGWREVCVCAMVVTCTFQKKKKLRLCVPWTWGERTITSSTVAHTVASHGWSITIRVKCGEQIRIFISVCQGKHSGNMQNSQTRLIRSVSVKRGRKFRRKRGWIPPLAKTVLYLWRWIKSDISPHICVARKQRKYMFSAALDDTLDRSAT